MEYHDVMVCLGRSLRILEYNGISRNIVEQREYNDITVCLGGSLSILEYHGISKNIVE